MSGQEFAPQQLDHWLVIVAFVALSSWIMWPVYLDG